MTIIELLPRNVNSSNLHKLTQPVEIVDYEDPNKIIARYEDPFELSFEDLCMKQVRLLVEDENALIVAF